MDARWEKSPRTRKRLRTIAASWSRCLIGVCDQRNVSSCYGSSTVKRRQAVVVFVVVVEGGIIKLWNKPVGMEALVGKDTNAEFGPAWACICG